MKIDIFYIWTSCDETSTLSSKTMMILFNVIASQIESQTFWGRSAHAASRQQVSRPQPNEEASGSEDYRSDDSCCGYHDQITEPC